ncbi:hypothetical protein [Mesorhizobium sp.]|uniref:hypothetical protein n=1 Tax=Mesorhizobium sp. TaxID=1871066 RepID=UPI000FE9DC3B|nr:hypothetical protein [Mesorhizobium sp.]RWD70872.1 MAG: toprim domain-containing protein [Mesorhizobium sp.]
MLHLDTPASGAFGDLQTGIQDTWTEKRPSSMTAAERAELKKRMAETQKQREEERAALNAAAAAAAVLIMASTEKAPASHPYLSKKGLPPFPGLRRLKQNVKYVVDPEEDPRTARAGSLVVPLYTPGAELISVQLIGDDGTKRFLKGTAKEGNYHPIGKRPEDPGAEFNIAIAEGYSTAARVHQATGFLTITAFDAGNLGPVSKAIRAKYPNARIIFAADNDRLVKMPDGRFNPGVTKAKEAAEAVGGLVAFPVFDDAEIELTDFDDLARKSGVDRVREVIDAVLNQPARTNDHAPKRTLPREEDFSFGEPAPAKPEIKIRQGAIHKAVDDAITVLSDPTLGIFARGEVLVRPVEYSAPTKTLSVNASVEGNLSRPDGSVIVGRVDADSLIDVLTRYASFLKWDARSKDDVDINCPPEVARLVLARRGFGWTMPRLRAIIQAPCLRDDGTVINSTGYDASSGLLFLSNRLWPFIPEAPSFRDALDAIEVLVEPISQLPFVANSDRSAALALLITAVIRPILKSAPMFAVTAPSAGTGKSLTVDVASVLTTGRRASVITPTQDEAELEKRIGAAAIAGDAVIAIDNVSHVLRSDQLCQMLTSAETQVRVLGRSEVQSIQSTTLICCTGNNLSIFGDLNRRTIRIRLDAKTERPDERPFTFDAIDLAMRKRAELVTAALTIVRAYLVAGRPKPAPPMGSFEDWSGIVRSALIWLNMGDPRGDITEMRAEDPEKTALAEVLEALPSTPFTVKEIKRKFGEDAELRSALGHFADKAGGFSTARFSGYLRKFKNTPVGGRAIQMVHTDEAHGSTWFVGPLEAA